jgi:hypothetical protein
MKHLREMVGEEILGLVPMMDPQIFQVMVLHGVEEGGIWVENQKLTTLMLTGLKQASSSKTPLFFVPFHEIRFLMQSTEKSSLSEKAFGL